MIFCPERKTSEKKVNCGLSDKQGWAFGLGLERLAMIFFDINDIRYFWSEDERFLSQFNDGEITKFKEYSKFPSSARDFSFWIDLKEFDENGFFEIIRDNGRDLIENVSLIDEFKKEEKISRMYRITFQSNDRSLTNEEINIINDIIRNKTISAFNVIPR